MKIIKSITFIVLSLALYSLVFLTGCGTPGNIARIDSIPEKHYDGRMVYDSDNNMQILLASKAIDERLNRYILTIHTKDNTHAIFFDHRYLLVTTVTKLNYLYTNRGSILLPAFYGDPATGLKHIDAFVLQEFDLEQYVDFTLEKVENLKTKSDNLLPNSCALNAINIQVKLADEYKERLAWHSLLTVFYTQGGEPVGHCYCVFRLKNTLTAEGDLVRNQTFYAAELSGVHKVVLNRYDAVSVAKKLKPFVSEAYYDEDFINKKSGQTY